MITHICKKNLILKIYVTAFQLFVFDLTRFKQILKMFKQYLAKIRTNIMHKYFAIIRTKSLIFRIW